MNAMSLKLVLGAAAVLTAASATQAAVIAYEGLDYEVPGALGGKSGGEGFGANAWTVLTGDPTLGAGSLEYSDGTRDLVTEGNKLDMNVNQRAARNLDAAELVAGRTLWVSLRVAHTTAAAFPTNHAGFSLFSGASGTGNELFIGKPASATNWGVFSSLGNVTSTASGTADKDAFLLARLTYGATTYDLDLWINPSLAGESSLGSPSAQLNDVTSFNVTSVRISTGGNSSNYEFDEFRIGDTFADVAPVPEPAAAGLVSVVAAAVLGHRGRRRIRT
jgi:hypothetical protein